MQQLCSWSLCSHSFALEVAKSFVARPSRGCMRGLPRSIRLRLISSMARKNITNSGSRQYSEDSPIHERPPRLLWPPHCAIQDNADAKGVWLEPVPKTVVGEIKKWARELNVQPERTPGYWIDKPGHDTAAGATAGPDEKIVVFFHGGELTGEPARGYANLVHLPYAVLSQCPSARRAFAVEYRFCNLSPVYSNPFPAALLDAIAGYRYLVDDVGVDPANIILLGESAGGNLALALARYIAQNTAELSRVMRNMPSACPDYEMILLSPWCDLGTSHDTPGSGSLVHSYDFLADLQTGVFAAARQAYGDPLGFSATDRNPYLSPASRYVHASFVGFPRTFISVGRAERFVGMCRTLRDKMARDMERKRVTYHEPRVLLRSSLVTEGRQYPEGSRTIGAWLAERPSGT